MSLTVGFITGRTKPHLDWFLASLRRQKSVKRVTQIIVVDFYLQACDAWTECDVTRRRLEISATAERYGFLDIIHAHPPRPTIWQGPHRIMRENWWANSCARNTIFALCKNPWVAICDDRCVLEPTWMSAVKRAMSSNYMVCGSYQKRTGLMVAGGMVLGHTNVTGVDNREAMLQGKRIIKANGAYAYGCTFAMPIEWALQANGYAEDYCDGISMEDICFGMVIHNLGYPMKYDVDMRVIQDRTPSDLDKPFRREDKGVSPQDKSHKLLEVFANAKTSLNSFDLRKIRSDVLSGKPFPLPSASHIDWYDGKPHTDWDL